MKKLVIITLSGILVGGIVLGIVVMLVRQNSSSKPSDLVLPTPTASVRAASETLTKYQNDSGFSFEHPEDVMVTEGTVDAKSYANLTLTSKTSDGSLTFTVVDTKYKDLPSWKKDTKEATDSMKTNDLVFADMDAWEEKLNSGNTTLVAVGDGVLYTATVDHGSDFDYWENVYTTFKDTFSFELPESQPSADSSDEDVILEEDVVE